MLSDVLESACLGVKDKFEVISSEDMLAEIELLNEEIKRKIEEDPNYNWMEDFVLLGTDIVSLFPSLNAERSATAVREQIEKIEISWEEIDITWLTLYIHLNRDLCSVIHEIDQYLPKRRKGRRGQEAGMGSEECSKRYIEDNEKSNWTFPILNLSEREKRKLIGAAIEISIRFFFRNFTYTFGGKTYVQLEGGPIGARITMCVARLVLQHWREKYKEILKEGNIREKLSKIYVDDNRCVVEKIKPGLRFIENEGKFKFQSEWIEEDMKIDPIKRTIRELGKAMNSDNVALFM